MIRKVARSIPFGWLALPASILKYWVSILSTCTRTGNLLINKLNKKLAKYMVLTVLFARTWKAGWTKTNCYTTFIILSTYSTWIVVLNTLIIKVYQLWRIQNLPPDIF